MDKSVVVVKAVRTTVGRRNGGWSAVHPARLLGAVQRAVLDGVDPAVVGQVIGGTVTEVGEQSFNVTRTAWLAEGLPQQVPATTVDAQCGSSQQAFTLAAGLIGAGITDVAIACGVESMSRIPIGANYSKNLGRPLPKGLPVTQDRAARLSLTPLARVLDSLLVGVDPVMMLLGPHAAVPALIERNGLALDDIGLIEITEAFASVVISFADELKADPDVINPNGGAIALGHPLGATGCVLITRPYTNWPGSRPGSAWSHVLRRRPGHGDGWLAIFCSARRFAETKEQITEAAAALGRPAPPWFGINVWCGLDADAAQARRLLASQLEGLDHLPFGSS